VADHGPGEPQALVEARLAGQQAARSRTVPANKAFALVDHRQEPGAVGRWCTPTPFPSPNDVRHDPLEEICGEGDTSGATLKDEPVVLHRSSSTRALATTIALPPYWPDRARARGLPLAGTVPRAR
jgi:hypothetical protein